METFEFITEQDKRDVAWGMCVAGSGLTGMALGSVVSPVGTVVVGAAGLAMGLLTCKHVEEPIKRKLFGSGGKLSEQEVTALLQEIRAQRPKLSKREAIRSLAHVRVEVTRHPSKYRLKSAKS
jgi:hypothetical protein